MYNILSVAARSWQKKGTDDAMTKHLSEFIGIYTECMASTAQKRGTIYTPPSATENKSVKPILADKYLENIRPDITVLHSHAWILIGCCGTLR